MPITLPSGEANGSVVMVGVRGVRCRVQTRRAALEGGYASGSAKEVCVSARSAGLLSQPLYGQLVVVAVHETGG